VSNIQKLVGKLAHLGEGAPWVVKLMSHLFTLLPYALKSNAELLEKSSNGFRDLVNQITTNKNSGKKSNHKRQIKFAMKKASKMANKHGQKYLVNPAMRDKLNFI
jgi:hypothetical protein